ncbi:LamG-like jellyroll fold domain-containing protein [Streptomyces hesseae]|uniref:LamG-like jellyroll fold domain-containing protein n=1 Tax=Streptomyces hesseae TaxID=3075519 RepID=A0ABU2SHY6_9ACTN|nr:LamG-like jellyroll fold domain-containing protein [Streptomyces sp. DSM 40473]MDT0447494.1 LamG-like jellyroll fold domain-containing protein [Streptomyces sp. DSM 40473]
MSADEHLLKVYSDRPYVHTTTVRHQGTVVAFAMDDRRRVVYTVLDMARHDESKSELDAAYWSENPLPLRFPSELTDVGFAAAGLTALPVVKDGGRVEAAPGERLDEDEVDPFLSTTARLTALAPFHVISDGTHVVVLRQSVTADHPDAVHKLAGGGSSGTADRTDYTRDKNGAKVPLAADTLLCDRFLLVGGELKPVLEARYRRSRHRTRPDSAKDSLGTTDMEGRPFHEPTQKLSFVRRLSGGRFTALLVPTAVHGQQRWQIFAHNDATGRVDSFNIEQGRDGLFNLQGTQAWTSPDPAHRDAVHEPGPGTCPFTGQPLIPVVSTEGHAETALAFGEGEAHVRVTEGPELAGRDFTVEFWARRTEASRQEFLVGHGDEAGSARASLHIGFRADDRFTFAFYADDLNSEVRTTDTDWHHWACVHDHTARRQTVYRDGEETGSRVTGGDYTGTGALLLGRALAQGARAELDEVRVWNRARTAEELRRDKGVRLIGNDPGLVAYYRFDEGSGTRLFDQTDHARHGELVGGPRWVTSEAPIGDHPGVRRDSFAVTGRGVVSGLSAVLYHQQEQTAVGYGQEPKPAKRQARVLLSYATSGPDPRTGAATDESYLATVDFGVGRDGRLAQIPDELALPVLAAPDGSADVETISELDGRVRQLVQDITAKETEVADLTRQTADLPEVERIREAYYFRWQDIAGWTCRIRFKNARDGEPQYLAVRDDGAGSESPLIRTSDKEAKSALWDVMIPPGAHWSGPTPYHLRNPHTGKDMNVAGERRDNDAPLIVWPRNTGAWNTHFHIHDRSDGYSTVVNRYSEKTVCAPDRLGDRVVQYDSATVTESGEGLIAFERVALHDFGHPDIREAGKRVEALDKQLAELRTQRDLLDQRRREIEAQQAELAAARDELARLTGGLKGADDIALPMPQLSLDRTGLSASGALLAFARSADRPYLLDSASGSVVLYFRGANEQFFAAYYDTTVLRSSRRLAGSDGTAVTFTARDADTDLGTVRISVTAGGTPGLCDVTIERDGERETWGRVPRRAAEFAAIVNGAPEQPVRIGAVKSFDATDRLLSGGKAGDVIGGVLQLAAPLPAALPAGTPVTIGGHLYLIEAERKPGATSLRLGSGEGAPEPQAGDPVERLRYDHRQATSSRPGVPLSAGSRLVVADPGSAREVPLGEVADLVTGNGCRWRADKPGRAYSFDGRQNVLTLPQERLDRAAVTRDLTMEAWVKPEAVSGAARIVHAHVGDAPYTLGLLAPEATAVPALAFDGKSGVAMTENGFSLADQSFTVEFWARRTTKWDNKAQLLVGHGASDGGNSRALHIGFRQTSSFTFAFYGDDLTTNDGYDDTDWHHWACTFDATTREQTIYRDGVEEARRVASGTYRGEGLFSFGSHFGGWVPDYAAVEMDEVRLWGTARSAAEVRTQKNKRLSGKETGLTGYWPGATPLAQVGGKPGVLDRSGQGRHVHLRGGVTTATAPAALDTAVDAVYRVVAGVGDRLVATRDSFPPHEWSHLAAAYEQSWAVELTDGAYLEVPDNDALDIADDLTVEVFCRVDSLGTTQGLLSKGRAADGSGGSLPYRLLVLPDGKLEFAFEEPDGKLVRFASAEAVRAGVFHRLAVVRKGGRSTQERKGSKEITAAGADGTPVRQTVELVESVDVREWQDIRFFIDGKDAGTARYEGPGSKGNSGTLDIGRARAGTETHFLTGVVAEVRLWGAARDAARLGTPVSARDRGLTAHWTFEENAGNTAADTTGSHSARLRGARWARNPDPRGSSFRLYRNGVPLACDPLEAAGLADYGDQALTLGARLKGGTADQAFHGVLEEVRLWRASRTQEQILDNLFTRLKGEKEDLLAYWSFDSASTDDAAGVVRDEGLRGNGLTLSAAPARPSAVLSTAPVSSDAAQVRSALAAMRTPFHETVSGAPAVAEYADMQYTAKGEAFGVLKRAYGYLRDGRWHLVTGYKVGDLISEWVSQVQFDPQLIGYVEGAPPVPSENLTPNTIDPDRATYDSVASVELTEAEEVVHSLSSAKERSVDAAFGFALSNEVDVDMWMITAPLGFGVAKSMASAKVSAGVRGSLEFSNSWAEETSVSQGVNTARSMKVELAGSWEDPRNPLNTAVGRRYVPANMGFALVQSQTADVFALRLAHSGALVTYRIQPNPDIPKDWNVIPFPVNPRYTKQGTLDGTVGYDERGKVLDPDYTDARDRGEYSYFKPREAYALKRRIQREQQRLHGYYETVSTETHAPDPTAERAGRVLGGAIGGDTAPGRARDTAGSKAGAGFSRRDLVNTYVWTADGGFFAETTETTDSVSETTSGSYSLSGSVGTSVGTSFDVMGIGINAQLDASIGGGMTATRARGKDASRSFGLSVACAPSGNLQQYDANRKPVFDADGKPVNAPGKVDAYRFLSFYLGEDTEHFDAFFHKVVDPTWLENAGDPNAAALRQARQSDRKPPCWRVMHRVTFVSRLLPPVTTAGAAPLERTMRQLDVDSNYELVRRLDPYVKASATSLSALTDAVRTALADHLPELSPHAADVTGFLAQYYGVED